MLLQRLGLAVVAGLVALVGTGFLVAAADFELERVMPPAQAAAIVGAGLLVLAGIVLWTARARRPRELASSEVVVAALGLVARYVRSEPEKALIAALIAGVVSEWIGSDSEKKR